ncbi:MAG: phage tail family protein [Actinomycetota bacterium]|nr:phage tail family protein [Actinomycetota bacterium]
MPYPSPITYPSPSLYPGFTVGGEGRQVALDPNFILGQTDAFGVRWSLTTLDGYDGSPSPTLNLTQRARGHGATGSESFLTARILTLGGLIHGTDAAAIEAAFDRLNAAIKLEPFEILVLESGRIRNAMVQRQGEVIPTWHSDKLAGYSILVTAKDPRKFGDLVTATTRLPFSEGGLTFPVTFPITFTGVSGMGKVTINNPGNTQAPVWLRIDGPIPAGGWTVTHLGKQQSLTFATALALGAGEFVTVDMDRREVLAQGQAPRSGYVTSRGWFSLDPGDNDIAFSAANYSSTASLTISTKPSWS